MAAGRTFFVEVSCPVFNSGVVCSGEGFKKAIYG